MGFVYGNMLPADADLTFVNTVGQAAVFDAVNQYLARVNAESQMALRFFVERSTSDFTMRYYLPGNGYMQERDPAGEGVPGSVKPSGSWDVSLPLKDFSDQVTQNDVVAAYMTVAQLQRAVNSVVIRYGNTLRYEILRALMLRTNGTFGDPWHGNLTIRRLANTDGTPYPPIIGSMTEADEEHYAESGFVYTAIDDTHDPWNGLGMTGGFGIVPELEEHFGIGAGSAEIVSFINKAEVPYVTNLTQFVDAEISQIREGAATALPRLVPQGLPKSSAVLGRHRAGAWIVRWDYIPAHYILSVHTGAPAPLMQRIDPATTGLGSGLQLVSRDTMFPIENATWRARFGMGVGNRLNGVVVELGNGGTYTDPTIV